MTLTKKMWISCVAIFSILFGSELISLGYADLDAKFLPGLFGVGFFLVGILVSIRGVFQFISLYFGRLVFEDSSQIVIIVAIVMDRILYFFVGVCFLIYSTPYWIPFIFF